MLDLLPETLSLPASPLCLTSHPTSPLLTLGYTSSSPTHFTLSDNLKPSSPVILPFPDTPIRNVSHPTPTTLLLSLSTPNLHLFDLTTKSSLHIVALPSASSTLLPLSPQLFCAACEDGGIHLIDNRSNTPLASTLEQADYISELVLSAPQTLLAASGDASLCVYDLRMPPKPRVKLVHAFEGFNDDLTSLTHVKELGVFVAGTLSGALHVYDATLVNATEGEGSVHVDRFVGHPEGVTSVKSVGGGMVVTSSVDGVVREVDVQGRTLVDFVVGGGAGDEEEEPWPVEGMVRVGGEAEDEGVFAMVSHDEVVRFCKWRKGDDDKERQVLQQKKRERSGVASAKKRRKKRKGEGVDGKDPTFFDGL